MIKGFENSKGEIVVNCEADSLYPVDYLARIIKNNLRESDLVGRFGGEEFLVIFPGTPAENAKEVLQRVLEKVRNYNWQKYGIDKLTFSAGVTSNVKGSVTDIIDRADQNLYKAKKSGKNKVVGGD